MAGLNTFVTGLGGADAARLEEALRDAGYAFREVPHARFGAQGEDVSVVYYASGKLVVQGKGTGDFKLHRLSAITGPPAARLKELKADPQVQREINAAQALKKVLAAIEGKPAEVRKSQLEAFARSKTAEGTRAGDEAKEMLQ